MRLAVSCSAGLSPPGGNRFLSEPDRETAPLAQERIVFRPARHPVPLLRNVVTASSAGFEWHGRDPKSEGQLSYAIPLRPPNRQFVQKGDSVPLLGDVVAASGMSLEGHGGSLLRRRTGSYAIRPQLPTCSSMQQGGSVALISPS
jgi:hypothetical protein